MYIYSISRRTAHEERQALAERRRNLREACGELQ